MILFLSGCFSLINEELPHAATPQADVLKVVILLPGPIDDQGWSQAGYEGLKLIEQELGAQVAYVENVPIAQTEQEKIIRQYAQEKFELLIGHGGEYIPVLETMSEVFPDMQFAVVTNYEGNNRNLGALSIRPDEAGYLAGVVAALKTKTNQVAYIGGERYFASQREALGFEKGVKDTNPEADTSIAWVDSWSDQQKAQDIALTLVESGVDVLAVDADLAGLAALEVAEAEGIYAIGWVVDQHDLAPNAIIASIIQDMPQRILQSAILVQQGRWEGKQYQFGLQEGIVGLSPLYGDWTADEEAILNQVQAKILRDEIETLP